MNSSERESPRAKYLEKLRDPRWQKLRLQVFERDEWACQSCYDTEKTLAVHHKYYEKGKEPWEYPLGALITLCESCHEEESESRSDSERNLLHALREKGFFSVDVQNLAIGFHEMELHHMPEVVATAYEWALKTPEIQDLILAEYLKYLEAKGATWHKDFQNKGPGKV